MFSLLLLVGCASSKPDVVDTNEDATTIDTISDDAWNKTFDNL